jgi:hypothetical protein
MTDTEKKLRAALQSLVSDIDEMRCDDPKDHRFGPFNVGFETDTIEWPNLSILAEEAKKLLAETST